MDTSRTSRRQAFLTDTAYILVVVGGCLLAARWLFRWLLPLVLALPLAALLQRPRRWLEKRLCGGSRAAAGILVGLVLTLLLAAAAAGVWSAVLWLSRHTEAGLWEEAGRLWDRCEEQLAAAGGWLTRRMSPAFGTALEELGHQLRTSLSGALSQRLTEAVSGLLGSLWEKLPQWLIGGIVFVLAAAGLTADYDEVWAFLLRQLPPARQRTVQTARRLTGTAARRLLRAYGLLMGCTFLELLAGLWLLRIPRALLLAAVIALVDILPVLGAGTVLAPWAVICLLTGNGGRAAGLLALWGVISLVRRVLEPRVLSREMGLPSLVMLAVMLLGYRLAGFSGMLLFPMGAMLLAELHRSGELRLWK